MKTEVYYKKEICEIYCPQLSNPNDWLSGKMEIKIQDRNGKLIIFIDYKEVKEPSEELKGNNGIDKGSNVLR